MFRFPAIIISLFRLFLKGKSIYIEIFYECAVIFFFIIWGGAPEAPPRPLFRFQI